MKRLAIKRFKEKYKVNPLTSCWDWTGSLTPTGYGSFFDGTKLVPAYRFAYGYFTGNKIPEGLEIDHLCRNRKCVNPDHMEVVTHQENCRRGLAGYSNGNVIKSCCPKGHPYDIENTYHVPTGGRDCKICRKAAMRRWYLAHKEKQNV